MDLYAGKASQEVLDYLQKRRSLSVRNMTEPGPDRGQIETMIQTACRTPDHGKLFPWYFVVIDGEQRKAIGALLREAYVKEDPNATEAKLDLEAERFLRAPCVIGVVSRKRKGKHPAWEQALSAGAVCMNLCLAANALGFASNWLTEWYSYNSAFRDGLGLDERDHVAGFVYLGTPAQEPEERPRPDPEAITSWWTPDAPLKKGDDEYDNDKFPLPEKRFFP